MKNTFTLALALTLAGCATPPPPAENLNNDPSVGRLAAAAELAQRDLERLSRAENALAEQKRTSLDRQREATARAAVVPGFDRVTSEVFTLPYPKAIERIAVLAGYKFVPAVTLPSNPAMVNIEGKGRTLKEVMGQVMDQVPSDMRVHVYAATKTVVLAARQP
ncbi:MULTISPECIES: DotD/TraH family lipoprotein [Pseudomonadaceae]|jgi:hypothetical protein|uniref:DotD/TraH family lipoprotein n=1 Tax=Pseudomonadaceae TaxID=135621 RepID=UPI0005F25969|nr:MULTISPECIES: DotD/TraH family lipoprotein [Pseudomonadaceae]KJS33285.1 MAG: type IV secretion protein DotD [Pseudomonas sp. BRH_c35]EMA2592516.1 DotD/TraH family lipoprotein [Pseudomonas aeruginosa]MBD9427993.1 DotD/TraH family lipoprotein [Pseudomonas sp. PDM15]MBN0172503.1 DotD/TraH family lipoprotein [Pseudomonas aeruginosa]MBX6882381.1 DotD/TraH family lipoprotein [Pseudomonas aeruginosa]